MQANRKQEKHLSEGTEGVTYRVVFKKGTKVKIKNCTSWFHSYSNYVGEVGVIETCSVKLLEEWYGIRLANGKVVACLGIDLIRFF